MHFIMNNDSIKICKVEEYFKIIFQSDNLSKIFDSLILICYDVFLL